LQSLK